MNVPPRISGSPGAAGRSRTAIAPGRASIAPLLTAVVLLVFAAAPPPPVPGAVPEQEPSTIVALARAGSMGEAVRTAVALAGGLEFIEPGDSVLIKPNLCCPEPHPATTSPEVLVEVIQMVRERQPGRLVVGDQTFFVQETMTNLHRSGLVRAIEATGVEFVPFDDLPRLRVNPEGSTAWPSGYRIPALLEEVDHVINLAGIKTHSLARFTMSIKNGIGLIDANSRRHYHSERRAEGYDRFAAMVAQMALAWEPELNILDGTRAFVSGGPSSGEVAEPRLIVASRDRVAADVAGLAVLRYLGTEAAIQEITPWRQPLIRYAIEAGLGVSGPEQVQIASEGVSEIGEIERLMRQ